MGIWCKFWWPNALPDASPLWFREDTLGSGNLLCGSWNSASIPPHPGYNFNFSSHSLCEYGIWYAKHRTGYRIPNLFPLKCMEPDYNWRNEPYHVSTISNSFKICKTLLARLSEGITSHANIYFTTGTSWRNCIAYEMFRILNLIHSRTMKSSKIFERWSWMYL